MRSGRLPARSQALKVVGLMNVQYAIKDGELFLIEVNPRASRTVPFVSKAIGIPLAKLGARSQLRAKLKDLGFTEEILPNCCHQGICLPFIKFLVLYCSYPKCEAPRKLGQDKDFNRWLLPRPRWQLNPPCPWKEMFF